MRGFLVYLIFVLNMGSFCNHGVLAPSQMGRVSCGVILGLLCRLGGSWPRPMLAWSLAVAVARLVPWRGQQSSSVQVPSHSPAGLCRHRAASPEMPFLRGVELSTSFMMQYLFLLGDGFL